MKRTLSLGLLLICIALSVLGSPQKPGFVLSFGEMITGDIKVDLEKNNVLIKEGKNMSFLPASKVEKVMQIATNGQQEIFYSGNFGLNNKPLLFQALVDGTLPLLFREGLKFNEYEDDTYPPFFIYKNDQIFSLGESKKEMIAVFDSEFQNEIAQFIKENKINVKSREDLVSLFNYYNDFFPELVGY